jgi:uncharacterized protein (DUF952 family)/quercetin dioxygenase-like cupin family protein
MKVEVEELKARRGGPPWTERIVANDRFVVTVICQEPGHRNDWHYHLTDECWYMHEGELSWTIEGEPEPVRAGAGQWILVPANRFHLIQVHGDRPAIRVAVSVAGEPHRHVRPARRLIYHLAFRGDWERAREDGEYRISTLGRTLEEEGFIHCSLSGQVDGVASRFFVGQSDLVLLAIDEQRVRVDVRHEAVADSEERFPHVYGPLNVDAVVAVLPFTPPSPP